MLVIVGGSAAAVIEGLPETLASDHLSDATLPIAPLADIDGTTPTPDVDRPAGENGGDR